MVGLIKTENGWKYRNLLSFVYLFSYGLWGGIGVLKLFFAKVTTEHIGFYVVSYLINFPLSMLIDGLRSLLVKKLAFYTGCYSGSIGFEKINMMTSYLFYLIVGFCWFYLMGYAIEKAFSFFKLRMKRIV